MTDHHQQIADLEGEIDNLAEAAERCRKSMIVARGATVAGVLLVGASLSYHVLVRATRRSLKAPDV
jgi:hypothetical protein